MANPNHRAAGRQKKGVLVFSISVPRALCRRRRRRLRRRRYEDAFLGLFQIAVTNNWQDIMNANAFSEEAEAMPAVRWVIACYFCSFFMVIVWFGTNVSSVVIVWFVRSFSDRFWVGTRT